MMQIGRAYGLALLVKASQFESMSKLQAFRVQEHVPELVPGQVKRDWMDETPDRFAYRCLPLNMANVTGWELKLQHGFDATWNGGMEAKDITITPHKKGTDLTHTVVSHFASGVITFHTGYLFRTEPGWATWAMAPPNAVKAHIQALSGLTETDWLPFPFTMNWRFTHPGTVRFEKGEPFCFITLVEPKALQEVTPEIENIHSDPELFAEYMAWRDSRMQFNALLKANNPETLRESWQKHYMQGRKPSGEKMAAPDRSSMRLKKPVTKS